MKVVLSLLVLISLLSNDPLRTTKINRAKSQAKEAFNKGDYRAAAEKFRYLIDSLGVKDDAVMLNLAHAYYLSKDTANALPLYGQLAGSASGKISSKANQQLGVMANQRGRSAEALQHFRQAVVDDPFNDDARYNYEMLKKKLDQDQKKQDQQQKKNDQNKQDEKKPEPSEFAKRLKAQADALVARQAYREAYDLMMDGLKKDKTVSVYQDYIARIKDVADINRK